MIKNSPQYLFSVFLYSECIRYIFQQQMLQDQPFECDNLSDCVLSPKETEERRARNKTLEKIDLEIDKILSMNQEHRGQYNQFFQKIFSVEQHYKIQNQQLKQALAMMTEKFHSVESMYLSLKEELEGCYSRREKIEESNSQMAKQIAKLKSMVRNQEDLIDQYRRSIDEQVNLEKEFMKAEFQEHKAGLQKDFNRALMQIQKQYEQKIKKNTKQGQLKEYQTECRELKKFLGLSREGRSRGDLNQALKEKALNSEYSTNDQENRHNQAIFMI